MGFLELLEDSVWDAEGFEEDDDLAVQKACFVLVVVQNVEVFFCLVICAAEFYHAWT